MAYSAVQIKQMQDVAGELLKMLGDTSDNDAEFEAELRRKGVCRVLHVLMSKQDDNFQFEFSSDDLINFAAFDSKQIERFINTYFMMLSELYRHNGIQLGDTRKIYQEHSRFLTSRRGSTYDVPENKAELLPEDATETKEPSRKCVIQ